MHLEHPVPHDQFIQYIIIMLLPSSQNATEIKFRRLDVICVISGHLSIRASYHQCYLLPNMLLQRPGPANCSRLRLDHRL